MLSSYLLAEPLAHSTSSPFSPDEYMDGVLTRGDGRVIEVINTLGEVMGHPYLICCVNLFCGLM